MRGAWVSRHPVLAAVVSIVMVMWLVGVAVGDDDGNSNASPPASDLEAGETAAPAAKKKERKVDRAKGRPTQSTYLVTHIVDGDTIELGNGRTVRLVGIDTPEAGECGFEAASDALARLVLGRRVQLAVSDENKDQYGRLLRYVNIGAMDAGLRLIKRGLAIARYDSRDGYGYHPREKFYRDADARTKPFSCPKPISLVGGGTGGGSCARGYDPCIPPYPPDLDCGNLNGPIAVSGSDPHGLDADGDGSACES